jgi:hypothetical protein
VASSVQSERDRSSRNQINDTKHDRRSDSPNDLGPVPPIHSNSSQRALFSWKTSFFMIASKSGIACSHPIAISQQFDLHGVRAAISVTGGMVSIPILMKV